MLAGAFEALLGAIAVDQGLRGAKRFLRPFLVGRDLALAAPTEETNPKGRLQEVAQDRFRLAPEYRLIRTEGPAHARLFSVEAWLGDAMRGVGSGPSKRAAEQDAARAALIALAAEDESDVATIVRNGVCPPCTEAAGAHEQEQAVAASEGEAAPASGRRSRRRRSDG